MTGMEAASKKPVHLVDRKVGQLVAAYIAAGSHSQRTVAAHIGIDPTGLNRRINGLLRWNLDELLGIAEYLDVPVSVFLDFNGENRARLLEVRASRWTRAHHDGEALADVVAFQRAS